MGDNLDDQFEDLVSRLSDMPNPEVSISLGTLNEALMHLNETAMYIAEFISFALNLPQNEAIKIPHDIVLLLPQVVDNCMSMSASLHDILCDECKDYDEDDDEEEDEESGDL